MYKTCDYDIQTIRNEVVRRILENEIKYINKTGETYEVYARNLHFSCSYSDEEINRIADLCLKLLEELRSVNEQGFSREKYDSAESLSFSENKKALSTKALRQ